METTSLNMGSIPCYLIADQGSSRKSIRVLLTQWGVKQEQIQTCETASQARDLIKAHRPQVLFIDEDLVKAGAKEILASIDAAVPNGQNYATFMLTTRGTMTEASSAAGSFLDSVIMRPFTFEALQKEVSRVIEAKFFPNTSHKRLNDGIAQFKAKRFNAALDIFSEVKTLAPDMAMADFYRAEIFFNQDMKEEGQKALEQGLAANPTHYRCLLRMVDHLINENRPADAYRFARKLADHHPIPLEKLPTFIRLSIFNQKYHDVLELYSLVEEMKNLDPVLSAALSAGLVVCGLNFLNTKNHQDCLKAFKSAEILAKGRPVVLTRILVALSQANLDTELAEFLKRAPEEVRQSFEVKMALLENRRKKDPAQALRTALVMIASNTVHLRLFETAIELSIEVKRRRKTIENLIDLASHSFPNADWTRFNKQLANLP